MSSTPKTPNTSNPRRKSAKSFMITLNLSSKALEQFPGALIKAESPLKEASATTPKTASVPAATNGDPRSESTANTPVANVTPIPSSMPPPTEGPKKRGVKRAAGPALGPDGLPKPRGKPGPKKKARLEDGSIDYSNSAPRAPNGSAAPKLGPKSNQGAINAGLRALDRSGKPCRKWQKGSFRLKSFTGVNWEIPRWKAPPKVSLDGMAEGSASGSSSKENKDSSQVESDKSNNGGDIEMTNAPSLIASSPPAPTEATISTPTVAATA